MGLTKAAKEEWQRGKIQVELFRERPFAVRDGDVLLSGSIDRLVVIRSGGRPIAAEIIDFKTDEILASDARGLAARMQFYQPQIEAYRIAVARQFSVEADRVAAQVAFLPSGIVKAATA
jgi:RecB family exonuclease